jgi:Peptidase family M41
MNRGGIPGGAEDLRRVTAYHEAGHAVLALALGRPVDWVSIRPDRQFLGLCAFRKAVFRPSEDWLEREAIIALGGLAAEARFTGAYCWDGAGRDYDYVFDLAKSRQGSGAAGEALPGEGRALTGPARALGGSREDRGGAAAVRGNQRTGSAPFF